jgi:hypothetical protein
VARLHILWMNNLKLYCNSWTWQNFQPSRWLSTNLHSAVVVNKKVRIQCVNIPIKMWVYASILPLYDPKRRVYDVYPRISSSTALNLQKYCVWKDEIRNKGFLWVGKRSCLSKGKRLRYFHDPTAVCRCHRICGQFSSVRLCLTRSHPICQGLHAFKISPWAIRYFGVNLGPNVSKTKKHWSKPKKSGSHPALLTCPKIAGTTDGYEY